MTTKRRGSILFECIIALSIFCGLLGIGYQMIDVLNQEAKHLVQRAREREGRALKWRIHQLSPTWRNVQVSANVITFQNDKGVVCRIRLDWDRLIYQKKRRGYYVLCTNVSAAEFKQIDETKVELTVNFVDGTTLHETLSNEFAK